MAKFMVDLDEAARERLEAHRVALGKRTWADVIRHWIGEGPDGTPVVATPRPSPSFSHGRPKTVVVETKRKRVDVQPPARVRVDAPQFQSRLKGEWKAP